MVLVLSKKKLTIYRSDLAVVRHWVLSGFKMMGLYAICVDSVGGRKKIAPRTFSIADFAGCFTNCNSADQRPN